MGTFECEPAFIEKRNGCQDFLLDTQLFLRYDSKGDLSE